MFKIVNLGRDLVFGACGVFRFFFGVEQCKGDGLFEGLVWSKEGISFMLLDDSMPKGL